MKWTDAERLLRLTLDWDSEADLEEGLARARNGELTGQTTLSGSSMLNREASDVWELWESANHGVTGDHVGDGDGYHYIEWAAAENIGEVALLRSAFNDDALRYARDRTRWNHGSPFYQTLYDVKGTKPGQYPPYTGAEARAELIDTHGYAPGSTKNDDGTVDWAAFTAEAAEHAGGQAALGRLLAEGSRNGPLATSDAPRKVVYNWVHGKNDPHELHKQQLRRLARKNDLGHYRDGKAVSGELPYETRLRRAYTEGINIPWYGDDEEAEEEDDSPSRNVQVRTGYFGDLEDAREGERVPDDIQLRQYHDEVMDTVIDLFEPPNYDEKDLTRADAGAHYEMKPLHVGEAEAYVQNAADYGERHGSNLPASLYGQHVVVHIILWDEDFQEPLWVFLGLCHGGFTEDHHELPRGMRVIVDEVDPSLGGGRQSSWWP